MRPIIPLRETPAVKAGKAGPPTCEHGTWRFAGSDSKRGASKWRCPTGECSPASRWVAADRLHPLVPRETPRWRKLYKGRASVEREFGRLKHEWSLLPLRVRGIERVRLHADLTILAKLACAGEGRSARGRALAQLPPPHRGLGPCCGFSRGGSGGGLLSGVNLPRLSEKPPTRTRATAQSPFSCCWGAQTDVASPAERRSHSLTASSCVMPHSLRPFR